MRVLAEAMGNTMSTTTYYTHFWYRRIFYQQEVYLEATPLIKTVLNFGWEGSFTPTTMRFAHIKKEKSPMKTEAEFEKKEK